MPWKARQTALLEPRVVRKEKRAAEWIRKGGRREEENQQLDHVLGGAASAREDGKDDQRRDGCRLAPEYIAELGPDDNAGWREGERGGVTQPVSFSCANSRRGEEQSEGGRLRRTDVGN